MRVIRNFLDVMKAGGIAVGLIVMVTVAFLILAPVIRFVLMVVGVVLLVSIPVSVVALPVVIVVGIVLLRRHNRRKRRLEGL